jgi:hypothetical protein
LAASPSRERSTAPALRPEPLAQPSTASISSLEFNHYTYQNIQVNGAVAKKKFNGELLADDPNLNAHLNGLIDFTGVQPKFDFQAEVRKADLNRLNFVNKKVEFNGKFKCNFTGDDIDNFLGKASIYDASIYKNGERVSFDSLDLESSVIDNNKTITVVSNEFDGAIVGVFNIKDLPASFQTFLNKYYPSYIKPAKSIPANQNFSFVITTKKVEDYIDLFNTDLSGFNNAGLSGRIDTRNNLLDLNVDLPSFSYKHILFDNLTLKGRGSLDSLSMETTIGDVTLNDSLHFPGTRIFSSIPPTTSPPCRSRPAPTRRSIQPISPPASKPPYRRTGHLQPFHLRYQQQDLDDRPGRRAHFQPQHLFSGQFQRP